jgi:hypothetical protein
MLCQGKSGYPAEEEQTMIHVEKIAHPFLGRQNLSRLGYFMRSRTGVAFSFLCREQNVYRHWLHRIETNAILDRI